MSIFKRKDSPSYWIRFNIKGIRIQESTRTTNKKEAQLYEEKRRKEIRQEIILGIKPERTWDEAEARWLKEMSHKKSISDDKSHFKWLKKHFKNKNLSAINKQALEFIINKKKENNVSNSTVNRLLALIKSVLNKAKKEWEWVSDVPYVKPLKEFKGRFTYLTKEQFQSLTTNLPTHLRQMAIFSVMTGLRASNVTNLKWEDIDLSNQRLIIKGKHFKNGRDFGIPLNHGATMVLKEVLGQHPIYVFTYKGHKITQVSTKAWYKACNRAGLNDFRWHDLRHTWASWFVQNGGSLRELQELGGWSSFQMCLRYSHLSPDNLKKASELVKL